MRECKECNGTGKVEVMNCKNQSNECCGGCYKEIECEECEGTSNCHTWEDIEGEFNEMVNFWDLTEEELQTLINNTNFKKQ